MENDMDDVKKAASTPAQPASAPQTEDTPKAEELRAAQASAAPKVEEKTAVEAAPKPKAAEPEYFTLKAKPPKGKKPKEDVEAAKKIANRYLGIQALEKIVNAKKARQKKKAAAQRFKPPETPEEFYERGQRYATGADCAVPFQERVAYLRKAADMFAGAGEYNDAPQLAQRYAETAQRAEQEGYENAYAKAMERKERAANEDDWFEAARAFERIPGYRDADEQAAACQQVLDRRSHMKRPLLILKVAIVAALILGGVLASRTAVFRYRLAHTLHHMGLDNVAAAFLASENDYRDSQALLEEIYYDEGVERMETGNYKKALTALNKCTSPHSDLTQRLNECNYALGDEAFQAGHNKTAKDYFKACTEGYKDREERIDECNYYQALDSLAQEDWTEAVSHFASANGYADSGELRYEPELKLLQEAQEGDKVFFGAREYVLLQRQGDTLTLLSSSLIHDLPYHQRQEAIDWAHSTLRSTLNSAAFLDENFTQAEQALLLEFDSDRISLLDEEEYLRYQKVMGDKDALWWLRDQGDEKDTARFVSDEGAVMEAGYPVDSTDILVRPVLRMELPN